MEKITGRKIIILIVTLAILIGLYLVADTVPPHALEELGKTIPLPLFTVLIALVDGFNPCNLFIITMLISLMISESHDRKKILVVGFSFISVVYIFYFLFMAAWLNIFTLSGFTTPLRIGIAAIAIVAGIINCKELFFYRKGITLMIQDRHVGPVKKKIAHLSHLLKKGSYPALIGASVTLALFASAVELPCTAGFPIIYTGILSGTSGVMYYLMLMLYNLIYVTPLIVLTLVLGLTFKGKPLDKEIMAFIKYIGGAIMLILGIILLFFPSLLGFG
jgi:cytochrome c biogenesis protein CcdA